MAATSAVSAIFDLYNSISAATFGGTDRPPLRLGEQSQTDSTGAQQRLPYVVLHDEGLRPEFASMGGLEKGTLRVEVYAEQVGGTGVTVDSIVAAIKYAGQDPADRAGFDWGTLTLQGALYAISLKRVSEKRKKAGINYNGKPAHMAELVYECTTGIKPTV